MEPVATVTVPARFNGPRGSGNGGYGGGVFAAALDGPAEVSLRSPIPLDEPLRLERGEEGALQVLHGETLVGEARPLPFLDLAVPDPVTPEQARSASERYRGLPDGVFSECFVCGRAREDSFGVFAGEVEGRQLVASPWTPPEWAAGEDGAVRPELVWAALDCPTFFAAHIGEPLTLSMLVRQRTSLDAPVAVGEEQVVVGWPIEAEGRKRLAGSAVLSAGGDVLARSEILLVEPR
ncbi:MAG TPA: hypothetical protein VHA54_10740 [Solirubrobacterales bacterium]|nr:hypothetical protein [Solirubrobacterales bacterium]